MQFILRNLIYFNLRAKALYFLIKNYWYLSISGIYEISFANNFYLKSLSDKNVATC